MRKPARCHFTTVRGVTRIRGVFHPDHSRRRRTQNSLCTAANRRRGTLGLQREELLTEGEILQDETLTRTAGADQPADEVPEQCDHDENLTGIPRIDLVAKSLISRVHEVLTNDNSDTASA